MPVLPTGESAAIKAWFGSSRGSTMPSSWTVDLFDADPRNGGVVLSGGGYSSLTVANNDTNFPESSGVVTVSLSWTASSGAWSAFGQWVVFSSGGVQYFAVPLAEPIVVASTGVTVAVSVPVFFDSLTDVPGVE